MTDLGFISALGSKGLRTTPSGELLLLCKDGSIYEMRKVESTSDGSWKRKPLYCFQPMVTEGRS